MSSEQGRKPEHSEFNPDFALYCEDGYCVACGNGRWKAHMPGCSIGALLDKIERLQAALDDAVTLLPPERLRLLRPPTRELTAQMQEDRAARAEADHRKALNE